MSELDTKIEKLKSMIAEANHIAFFGGAGVSTESGIPDFRSKDGLYNQHDVNFEQYEPEYLLSNKCLTRRPKIFYEFYRQKLDCRTIEPNITHKKLAELEQSGKRVSIITQNIDGLHEKAGSKEIYNIHGTTMKNYCMYCHHEFDSNFIFESEEAIPTCPYCNPSETSDLKNYVRPDVTLYGEALPNAFDDAVSIVKQADLMIVAGTSLTVYPAANIISYLNENAYLVMINRDPTDKDGYADLVIHCGLGEVFSKL